MVKSYQEIVRTSSKRAPNGYSRTPPPLNNHHSNPGTVSPSPLTLTLDPDQPNYDPATGTMDSTRSSGTTPAVAPKEKKSRFHALAKLQMGSLGRSKKDKHPVDALADSKNGGAGGGAPPALGDSTASSPSRRAAAYAHGADPYGAAAPAPYAYPYPPYPPYGYGPTLHPGHAAPYPPLPSSAPPLPHARYPIPSTAPASTASTSVLPSPSVANGGGIPSTSASAHSPTSPTTPASTGVAHYYPYVASQPRRQNSGTGTMASPQSFKSRGGINGISGGREGEKGSAGEGSATAENGDGGRELVDGNGNGKVNGMNGSASAASSAAPSPLGPPRREPSYPPGAAPSSAFSASHPLFSSNGQGRSVSGGPAAPPRPAPLLAPPGRPSRAHSNPPPSSAALPLPPNSAPLPPPVASPHPSYAPSASTARSASHPPPPAQHPYPPHPAWPYPPYPPYPPPPGYPPYGYPYPYPPFGHPPHHPPPPAHPASLSQPHLPRPPPQSAPPGRPGFGAAAKQPSFSGSLASTAQTAHTQSPRGPAFPPSVHSPPLHGHGPSGYPAHPGAGGYGPHPFSAPAVGASPAVNAVAARIEADRERERERERERQRASAVNAAQAEKSGRKEDEGKLSVGIDFGTTFTGIAYGSSRLFAGQIRQILSWPGSYETYRKVPTCILYSQPNPNEEAKVVAWGIEAKNATVTRGLIKCEWFKLLLSPEFLRSGVPDPWLPPLPAGKNVVDVIADFLRCVWRYARRIITEEIGSVVDLNAADVLLTVPAAWDAAACALMRESALRAGLVQSSRGGDVRWRDRLQIITEPEAGAIHASSLATLHHLRPSQCFLLCDAGGGTVDSGVYKLMGQLSELEIAEMCVRSGANTGSLFVDLKFEELLRRILKDHPVHLEPASMATFIHAFAEGDKLAYHGTAEDDVAIFRFNCFNVEDSHDPAVGLEFGELAIPGKVLKTEVFDPVIEQVLDLISNQMARVPERLDAIVMIGGFSASEYLYTRVRQAFGATVPVIVRPQDCDTATLRGAAKYGLGLKMGKGAVSSVIAPRSYCMKSKLPAEEEDHWRRPEFITTNDGGTVVCENRLSYLIAKGAVLRKGERLRSRFCKFVKDPHDSMFTAHLYVSDSEELYRYTDEGDLRELCRWTLDLETLPRFSEVVQHGGGYIEFEAGLSLDSAEVRGVLMTEDGVECAAATFEFLGT
ncbi:hypothetical protein JCM8097_000207 [Rhodosporidiobolus ruineniae]